MSADADDLLTSALLPGERIVWSDRPRGFLWPVRAAYRDLSRLTAIYATIVLGIAFALPVLVCVAALTALWLGVLYGSSSAGGKGTGGEAGLGALLACLVGGPAMAVVAFEVRDLLRAQTTRYAVTDRARGFVAWSGRLASFELPRTGIRTVAHDGGETADIDFGVVVLDETGPRGDLRSGLARRIVFHEVTQAGAVLDAADSRRKDAETGENAAPAQLSARAQGAKRPSEAARNVSWEREARPHDQNSG